MFEKAARLKLRFEYRGLISTEDLWDLHVEDLDNIYKSLNSLVKTKSEESLLDKKDKVDEILDLKIDIIKHVVNEKLQEAEARELALERRVRKQKLMAILEKKQDEELHDLSSDKLEELIAELG